MRRSHHIVGHLANNVTEAVTARNLLLWNVETQVCVEKQDQGESADFRLRYSRVMSPDFFDDDAHDHRYNVVP